MNILALIGSPRKGGNTEILVDQILKGSRKNGHLGEKLHLYDYEISPCLDCRFCKTGDYRCAIRDDMLKIYPKMQMADIIVFATPLYWYGPTAKMKLLIDRMRPFIASKKLQGKKAFVVVPSEEGPNACEALLTMFQRSFDYLGMQLGGKILAKAYEKGEIAENRAELEKAYELGLSGFGY